MLQDRARHDVSPESTVAQTPDRREHARHVTVMRVAKLYTPDSEELCLVRNLSAGGMMTHVYSGVTVGTRVTVEFRSGWIVPGKIQWREDDVAGVQFDQPIDCLDLLTGRGTLPLDFRARAPRVKLEMRARIRIGARYRSIVLHDISQGGAAVEPGAPEELGAAVVLMVPGLPPATGTLRWVRDGRAGIAFDVPLQLETLGRWLSDVQERRARGEVDSGDGADEPDRLAG